MRLKVLWILVVMLLLAGCRVVSDETSLPTQVFVEVPTQTLAPTLEPTLAPTPTPQPSPTPVPPTPTPTPKPFDIQSGMPLFAPAFAHTEQPCGWMGVAGQVFGSNGQPINNLVVAVVGNVAGKPVDSLGFTGLATVYGPGGYEVQVNNAVAPGIFWLQIYDLAGNKIAEELPFQMIGGCDQNLAIINFVQSDPGYQAIAPVALR